MTVQGLRVHGRLGYCLTQKLVKKKSYRSCYNKKVSLHNNSALFFTSHIFYLDHFVTAHDKDGRTPRSSEAGWSRSKTHAGWQEHQSTASPFKDLATSKAILALYIPWDQNVRQLWC